MKHIPTVLFIFVCCMQTALAASQPKYSAKNELLIAVFQYLGLSADKQYLAIKAFERQYHLRTDKKVVPMSQVAKRLGGYGEKKLSVCAAKIPCWVANVRKHFNVRYGLLLGLGGIGDKIMARVQLMDFSLGKRLMSLDVVSVKNRLQIDVAQAMKKLFPNYGEVVFQGLPQRTTIILGKKVYAPGQRIVLPVGSYGFRIVLPGFNRLIQLVTIQANKRVVKEITALEPIARRSSVQKRKVIKPKTPKPFILHKQWWFWGLVGIGVGSAIIIPTGIVMALQKRADQDGFIVAQLP